MRRVLAGGILALAACMPFAISACSKGESQPSSGSSSLTIADDPQRDDARVLAEHPCRCEQGGEGAGHRADLAGTAARRRPRLQVSEIEGFISRGVSGITIAPLDEAALVGPVTDAMDKKIPVVIFDSGLKGDNYVSFVATDNFKGGQLGGERLIESMGGKGRGRFAPLRRRPRQHDEARRRVPRGDEGASRMEVVSANQYVGTDVEEAYKRTEDNSQHLQEA